MCLSPLYPVPVCSVRVCSLHWQRRDHSGRPDVSQYSRALDTALADLIETIEARGGHSFVASILILDGKNLRDGAAPHLPARYRDAINGIEIGPKMGSCGTAAFCGHPIYVSDIANDPLWAPWTEIAGLALEAGLRACWSVPIVSGGRVLGTFAIYHRERRIPTAVERDLIAEAVGSAAILLDPSPSSVAPTPGAAIHH
jgi:GAF domain-containing protein